MNDSATATMQPPVATSFFARPHVHLVEIPVGPRIPLGIEQVSNPALGIGGAYGAWGYAYDNAALPAFVAGRLGRPLGDQEKLNLGELGFVCRHHVPEMSDAEHLELELAAGTELLRAAIAANGWQPAEVEALLLGMTAPIADDFIVHIARTAGIPDAALKISIHKACDGSVAGLNLVLNPDAPAAGSPLQDLASALAGKKVLVGGFEGLSRYMCGARDAQALQLFGTGAGLIGVIPGQTMKFLAGSTLEVYDQEGLLQVRMAYPHSRGPAAHEEMLEVTQVTENHLRVAGLMHEPEDARDPVVMAGPLGMVKLFVRTGVQAVRSAYRAYQHQMERLGTPDKQIAVVIAHHANLKINQLKGKHLEREGICLPTPWLLSDFGNVSVASNMIAFLRQLGALRPGDHVLFDGFGAGTYYDVLAVELSGQG